MDESTKGRVSELLSEASRLLSSPSGSTSNPGPAVNSSRPTAFSQPTINETLRRAEGMLRDSASAGLCRRLNRQERLRAASGPYQRNNTAKKTVKKEKKALEFALLRCWDSEDQEELHHLKWDSIIANGMLVLEDCADEITIRKAVKDSLTAKFPLLGVNDFEFVKVRHKAISTLQLGPGTEYNYSVVKKMAGQGLVYLKVKQGFEFVYNGEPESDEDLLKSTFDSACSATVAASENQIPVVEDNHHVENQDLLESASPPSKTDQLIEEIHKKGMSDPVEILRFLQKELLQGRDLDVTSESELMEGETNYICIDRHDILKTTFTELASIENFHITFEVDFMGEKARDLGGPRKEWIRLMNLAVKEKYFDHGLREHLSDDYFYVGIMMGIALLQNGQLPTFLPINVIEELATSTNDSCIVNLQRGLDVFGFIKIFQKVPVLLHLVRPTTHKLAARMLLNLLSPKFSEEGSTCYLREKQVYALFVKYVREVSSGRRDGITLSNVLVFVTGASEEPVLGFVLHPSIKFALCEESSKVHVNIPSNSAFNIKIVLFVDYGAINYFLMYSGSL